MKKNHYIRKKKDMINFLLDKLCFPIADLENSSLEFATEIKEAEILRLRFNEFNVVKFFEVADVEVAGDLLIEQIKPFLSEEGQYVVVLPNGYTRSIYSDCTRCTLNFTIVIFGTNRTVDAQSVADAFVRYYCTMLRIWHNKYISEVSINSTDFSTFSNDNSETTQYTASCALTAVLPYSGIIECNL